MTLDLATIDPVWLAIAVFLARIVDVSLATFRTIMVFRGQRVIAATIGFFEVLIWMVAVSSVIANLDRWFLIVAYAAGFATGNFIGMVVESRIAFGAELVRTVSTMASGGLAQALHGYGWNPVTVAGVEPGKTAVEVVLVVTPRRRVQELISLIQRLDPRAVSTTTDIRAIHEAGATSNRLSPPATSVFPGRRK